MTTGPDDIFKDLRQNIYCRLAPSKIHGVGVFAIRAIPAGVNPFSGFKTNDEGVLIKKEDIEADPLIPAAVKKLTDELIAVQDGAYLFPQTSLNELNIAFFVNHSETPNLKEENDDFITLREIQPSEELTANYTTYAENI